MVSDFTRFTQAVQQDTRTDDRATSDTPVKSITVLGGGPDGRLLAALFLAEGFAVTLFSAYGAEMEMLRSTGGITLHGDGPVGTYPVGRINSPSIQVTAELDVAVASAQLICLTGPVHKQRTYAMVLADHLRDGQVLVIAPARTFGALETDWLLHVGGCMVNYTIIELQQLPFWVEASANTLQLSACKQVTAAVLPSGRQDCMQALGAVCPQMISAPSAIHGGFSDAGGAVECVSLLLGGSAIHRSKDRLPEGAVPLAERRTLRSLIENQYSLLLLKALLGERRETARRYGVRNLPDDSEWIELYSGALADPGARRVPDLQQAVDTVHCAVIGSLAPLRSAADLAGVDTPVTDSVIATAGASLDRRLDVAGRQLHAMGVDARSPEHTRRHLESISRGER